MSRSKAAAAALACVLTCAAATVAGAQECLDRAGEGTSTTRDGAMRAAYEAALRATDAGLLRAWLDRSQKIGEAPGWAVRRMTAKCAASGAGQTCRIETTLCRQ